MGQLKQFVLTVLVALVSNLSVNAFEVNGLCYEALGNGTCAVVQNVDNPYSGDIVIPEQVTYNDIKYTVTTIAEEAFYKCKGLTTISIPRTITLIEEYNFYGCTALTGVYITDLSAWCKIKLGYESLSGDYDYNLNSATL